MRALLVEYGTARANFQKNIEDKMKGIEDKMKGEE